MYIIAGLGNPGKEYTGSRHNIGFATIAKLADKYNIDVTDSKFKGLYGKGMIEGEKVLLVEPLTYMNNSGECIREILDYFKESEENLIVVYDDIDLAPGKLRVRPQGSAGGHNGIKSIIKHLGNQNFKRVRIGVGAKPSGWDLADWVLGHFAGQDKLDAEAGVEKACEAVACIIREDINSTMNKYN